MKNYRLPILKLSLRIWLYAVLISFFFISIYFIIDNFFQTYPLSANDLFAVSIFVLFFVVVYSIPGTPLLLALLLLASKRLKTPQGRRLITIILSPLIIVWCFFVFTIAEADKFFGNEVRFIIISAFATIIAILLNRKYFYPPVNKDEPMPYEDMERPVNPESYYSSQN